MPAERSDEEIARDALIEVPDYWSINAQGFVHIVERACKEARAQGVAEGVEKIRDALQFDVYREKDGMRIASDAYWNLSGAEEDMARTGEADKVCLNTIGRVLDQLHAAREIVRQSLSPAPKDEGE